MWLIQVTAAVLTGFTESDLQQEHDAVHGWSGWVWEVLWWSGPPKHSEVNMWVSGLCNGQWYRWREQYVSWQQTYESMSSSTYMSQVHTWVYCNYGHFNILRVVFYSSCIQTLFLKFLYEGYKLSWKFFKCFHHLFSTATIFDKTPFNFLKIVFFLFPEK